jgi:GAF domain-containing protein
MTSQLYAGGPAGSTESSSPVVDLRERSRDAAVKAYRSLDAPTDGTFDRIARIAATVFGTPIATVTIVDQDAVWFAAVEGLDGVTHVGTEPGLCTSAILQDGPYLVNDAATDPRTLAHPLVLGELGLRFYAAAPIITEDQFRLGTVNVIDAMPRQLTENQTAVLSGLARLVAKHLEVRLAAIRAVREEQRMRADAEQRAAADAMLTNRLRQATAAHRRVPHPTECQLGGMGTPCRRPAEIRVADSWGDSAWGCATHAEEAIVHVRNAFVASEDLGGLAAYVERR